MDDAQKALPKDCWTEIRYDEMMARPEETLRSVCAFLGAAPDGETLQGICERVSPRKLKPLDEVSALRDDEAFAHMFAVADGW